jgi:hypothetical protein
MDYVYAMITSSTLLNKTNCPPPPSNPEQTCRNLSLKQKLCAGIRVRRGHHHCAASRCLFIATAGQWEPQIWSHYACWTLAYFVRSLRQPRAKLHATNANTEHRAIPDASVEPCNTLLLSFADCSQHDDRFSDSPSSLRFAIDCKFWQTTDIQSEQLGHLLSLVSVNYSV